MREFDEAYTAPHFGFLNAEDYYHRASAMRVIDRIRVPALIITSEDDPFVPSAPFRDPKVTGNPTSRFICASTADTAGSSADRRGDDDGYWAEDAIVDFVTQERGYRLTDSRQTRDARPRSRAELRPLPRFFVLEVDEHVAAGASFRDR